ncbi:unnamed protein product [Phytophthora lilii]|uniref:Unnamed protein product n=1 Tax=Phytophthora lilii TaxID=2077276 RepID=A0A9W6U6D7_9STRA|nr:unnamed protein product [Phytophthora lilii]
MFRHARAAGHSSTLRGQAGSIWRAAWDEEGVPVQVAPFVGVDAGGFPLPHSNYGYLPKEFGIQARGGCQCAGPFGARLLGVSKEHTIALGHAFMANDEVLKPGVVRMSFPYFADDAEVDYILDAVNFVADHGWKLLPQYDFDIHTAAWHHTSRATDNLPAKSCLSELQFFSDGTKSSSTIDEPIRSIAAHRRKNLEQATIQADACMKEAALLDSFPEGRKVLKSHEWLRWFVYPHEVVANYKKLGDKAPLTDKITGPCQPHLYQDDAMNHIWDGIPSMSKLKKSRMGRLMLRHYMPTP